MKLEKAIEILEVEKKTADLQMEPDFYDAVSLGIEALKRVQEHREEHIDITYRALPGETDA